MADRTLALLLTRLGAHGGRLFPVLPPDASHVPAEELLRPEALREAVQQAASSLGTTDLRVAASLWQKQYNATVLMGALSAMTLAGTGLDGSAANGTIIVRDGMPRGLFLHSLANTVVYPPRLPEGL